MRLLLRLGYLGALLGLASIATGATPAARTQIGINRLEGILRSSGRERPVVKVRLILERGMRPVGETIAGTDGRFRFEGLLPSDYVLETEETLVFKATTTRLRIYQHTTQEGTNNHVNVTLPLKQADPITTGTVSATLDVAVPASARDRFAAGRSAAASGDTSKAISEYRAAIEAHPDYYSARLELGKEFRKLGRFAEALEALEPLRRIAPREAEPLIEIGVSNMGLSKRDVATTALTEAVRLDASSWSAHLYLGYALVDVKDEQAEPHFWTALKLNEKAAAKAHLALARLADKYGFPKDAVEQLDAYLALEPNAPDSDAVRKLADKLRKKLPKQTP
jgi:tetratricopeptide (TPR) repeat protein